MTSDNWFFQQIVSGSRTVTISGSFPIHFSVSCACSELKESGVAMFLVWS